jgi:hypothetical protein
MKKKIHTQIFLFIFLTALARPLTGFSLYLYAKNDSDTKQIFLIDQGVVQEGFRLAGRTVKSPLSIRDNYIIQIPESKNGML